MQLRGTFTNETKNLSKLPEPVKCIKKWKHGRARIAGECIVFNEYASYLNKGKTVTAKLPPCPQTHNGN